MFQSTHSLRSATVGGDRRLVAAYQMFQSTHSLRSATRRTKATSCKCSVSIHALLAECDLHTGGNAGRRRRFNPRTPCGVRQGMRPYPPLWKCFNPRTPCGVRHDVSLMAARKVPFQSTHSLRSATVIGMTGSGKSSSFNPRTPCGVRPAVSGRTQGWICFNPRTPCGVRLRPTLYIATQQSKSYFAPTSLKRPSLHGCSF